MYTMVLSAGRRDGQSENEPARTYLSPLMVSPLTGQWSQSDGPWLFMLFIPSCQVAIMLNQNH